MKLLVTDNLVSDLNQFDSFNTYEYKEIYELQFI